MAEVANSEGSSPLDIPPELLEYFLNDPSYIVCPQCNNVWENAGAGNENDCRHVRTENGKLLNTSAREHYTKYRFRCPRCESIFCSSCKIIPYHLGFTCTEFDEAIKSLKCRWCKEKNSWGDHSNEWTTQRSTKNVLYQMQRQRNSLSIKNTCRLWTSIDMASFNARKNARMYKSNLCRIS